MWCHGSAAISGGKGPDLRESPLALELASFKSLVQNGNLPQGMPRFPGHSEEEIVALYHFVRREARKALSEKAE